MRTVLFLGFDEAQTIAPSDRVGTLGDLGIQSGLQPALKVEGWTGGGRSFTPANQHGFLAADNDGEDSLLTRDVTIQAIVSLNMGAATGPLTLICRGIDGSASEYYAYGIELEAGVTAGDVVVRWFWADQAGVLKTQAGTIFTSPGDGKPFLLTATRRWESTTRVVCRYYAADKLLAEQVSTDGSIGGGTTGHTSIGARKTAGTWARYFSGTIEQLAVMDFEISLEEIEARWRRLTVHQPEGVARFRAMSPPGAPWSRDPSSIIGRQIKVWGQLGGLGAAVAEETRNLLPDRAYSETLERWERLAGLSPRPLDSLDTRRVRVLAMMQRENGYSLPILRSVLAPLFDQDPSAVEILEFTNRIYEPFGDLKPERWTAENVGSSSWTIVAGKLRLFVGVGDTILPTSRFHLRTGLQSARRGAVANGEGTLAEIKIDSVPSWPTATNLIAGLYWYEFLTGDKLWIGVTKIGADWVLAHRRLVGGVLSALTSIATLGASPTVYVRSIRTASPTSMRVEYSTTSFAAGISSTTITCPPNPSYAGVSASADTALTTTTLEVLLDDFTNISPSSTRPFNWYAYRPPSLPGAPDLSGARTLVSRYKPAHTHAAVIDTKSFICGASLLGDGPLGGF